jgi:hypothetical protein
MTEPTQDEEDEEEQEEVGGDLFIFKEKQKG